VNQLLTIGVYGGGGVNMRTDDQLLQECHEWVGKKLQGEGHPPWAWYQYMKLDEALRSIINGRSSLTPTARLLPEEGSSANGLRLVDATYRPSDAQRHPSDPEISLPM
jgi:hypothetical protein